MLKQKKRERETKERDSLRQPKNYKLGFIQIEISKYVDGHQKVLTVSTFVPRDAAPCGDFAHNFGEESWICVFIFGHLTKIRQIALTKCDMTPAWPVSKKI